ncbi:iron-sulfur cluster carrier protein MrpORP [Dehalobacter restrictus]|jgi:Mrp family chromosome partitioning ATPase/predicted Fe-Mo cluster-binding NifX family protein|uniref:Iron-sulfur cluster carrier protein n=1 Tax=Dehalobacter restrictus (strain DSM 9455 / PER-K23) TaxID=871738 RepID=A0ABM5P2M5_DEHRP|nr:iron-sulfur cluster carrier protein MrpORP [Dehalobacter restrictus]AHF08731.1 dinitrogenase iron-molybdenum cofactor biosynthesis protein [Dehalobacter restrictus DSM 9455]
MSENCNQNCNTCSDECADRKEQADFSAKPHELSNIKKVIGIVSGKGGVGKSLVTSMMAVTMARRGYKAAILDADITGPSIPKAFGISQKPDASELGLFPAKSKTGIQLMSINLLLENETDPVIWRGPILSGVIKQFWSEVIWGDVDFMFIDMPPGTGDVPLTVFQSIKLDGVIIVASPQELVSMIVSKAVKMAKSMNIPILGLVENMSYFKCPDCGKEYKIFGESSIEKIAEQHQLKVLATLPIDPKIAVACDKGMIELYNGNWFDDAADILEGSGEKIADTKKLQNQKRRNDKMKIAVASEGKMVTEHFGHCEGFIIYEAENGQIAKSETIANPGHKPGFLPNFLNDRGVKVIISGGMGGGAIDIFNEKGIEVITGASGEAKTVVEQYLQGNLKSTGSVCHEHQHHDECGRH